MRRTVMVSALGALALLVSGMAPASSDTLPSGERTLGGKVAIEPAYNADTGGLLYLQTPTGAPFPSNVNRHAVAPLYLVEYPPGFGGTLNCMGVPGNCPDHNGLVAGFATAMQPTVYGTDPTAVPGHDHIVDPPGAPDWNVAWEVVEVLFTQKAVDDGAITHLTTDTAINDAVAAGYAVKYDLGFAFHCSSVSASAYWRGTPVG
jgi:hypothetical protein